MTTEPLSCPYCNALVSDPGFPGEGGRRVICSRCGETFPFRAGQRAAATDAVPLDQRFAEPALPPPDHAESPPSAPTRAWSNRAVGAVVLACMGLMALLGYIFALSTTWIRRGHDTAKPPPESITVPIVARVALGIYIVSLVYAFMRSVMRRGRPEPASIQPSSPRPFSIPLVVGIGLALLILVVLTGRNTPEGPKEPDTGARIITVAPGALPALGYLPETASVVAGIHVTEVLADSANKPLVDQVLLVVELLGIGDVEKTTGLKLEDYDHLAIGWQEDETHSQVTVVVQTRKPYSSAALSKTLRSAHTSAHGGKPLYSFQWQDGRKAFLWCAAPHTFVLAFSTKTAHPPHMSETPLTPRTRADRLPYPLRKLFKERPMPLGTPLWVAGSTKELKTWLALTPLPLDVRTHLAAIREFRLGLRLDREATVTAELHTRDPGAATELFEFLQRQKLARLELSAHRSPLNNWVSVQIKLSQGGLKGLFLGNKAK